MKKILLTLITLSVAFAPLCAMIKPFPIADGILSAETHYNPFEDQETVVTIEDPSTNLVAKINQKAYLSKGTKALAFTVGITGGLVSVAAVVQSVLAQQPAVTEIVIAGSLIATTAVSVLVSKRAENECKKLKTAQVEMSTIV